MAPMPSPSGEVRTFPPDLRSVRDARLFVQRVTGCDASDPVALLVSELSTNAVLHARTEFTVSVRCEDDATIRVEVTDGVYGAPTLRKAAMTPDGRGLQIVSGLAQRWGIDQRPDGAKTVWFELSASR